MAARAKWEHNASTGNDILRVKRNCRIVRANYRPPLYKTEFWGDYSLRFPIRGPWTGSLSAAKAQCSTLARKSRRKKTR